MGNPSRSSHVMQAKYSASSQKQLVKQTYGYEMSVIDYIQLPNEMTGKFLRVQAVIQLSSE